MPKTMRHRSPMIGPHSPKVDILFKDAARDCKSLRGHTMTVWRAESNWGEMKCSKCGKAVGVALVPPPGGKKIAGPALREECTA